MHVGRDLRLLVHDAAPDSLVAIRAPVEIASQRCTWMLRTNRIAGLIDQSTFFARSAPFRLMTRILRTWHA